nr:hypothetical protein [Halomicroarcula salinisoli]
MALGQPELAKKWADYGQGEIVNVYPLTYRDDLDDLDPEFQDEQGFVDWYRFGVHDRGEEWVRDRTRSHELIEFGDDGHDMESTAGAYLGKYLSATFGSLPDASDVGRGDEIAITAVSSSNRTTVRNVGTTLYVQGDDGWATLARSPAG